MEGVGRLMDLRLDLLREKAEFNSLASVELIAETLQPNPAVA